MSDDIANALQSAGRSSSVLGAIANPPVVNPLAAMSQGISVARNVYDLRQQQATEAAGKAYQGAIDQQTGEFDPNKFRTLLAQSGPAAMAAGAALLNTQNISSNQLDQNLAKAKWVNAAAGAALQSGDFSDGAMLRLFQTGLANGTLTMPEVQRQMQLLPSDAAGRRQWLQEHQMTSASVQQQLEQTQGTQQTIPTPQGTYTVNVPPISAGKTVVIPHGPAPGTTTEATVPMDEQGVIPQDANGVPTRTPKTWQKITVPVTAVPGVPRGGPPTAVPSTTGAPAGTAPPPPPPGAHITSPGIYVAPGSTPPATPAPVATPPAAVPPVATPPPAMSPASSFGGGAFARPSVAPPPSPATIAAPAPTAPPPTTTASPATTATPIVRSEPPQGQPEKLKADVTAYTQDQQALPDQQTRAQNLAHAYEALNLLKSATGRGAQGINDLRSYAQTLGLLPAGAVNEQKLYEIVHKYTERTMIDAAGAGTDLGRRMQEQANAGTLLSTPANVEILRNDMGKALQNIAAYKDFTTNNPKTDGAGYLARRAEVADTTDPRGFVWSLYSPEEQAKIQAEVKGTPGEEKLHRAIGMVKILQLQIPGSRTAPPEQKQSLLMPPAAAPNPLAMAMPPTAAPNPLTMAA